MHNTWKRKTQGRRVKIAGESDVCWLILAIVGGAWTVVYMRYRNI